MENVTYFPALVDLNQSNPSFETHWLGVVLSFSIVIVILVVFFAICIAKILSSNNNPPPPVDLELQQVHIPPAHVGVDPWVRERIPQITYSEESALPFNQGTCGICLQEFENEEAISIIPSCGHALHTPCLNVHMDHFTTCLFCQNLIGILADADGEDVAAAPPADEDTAPL